MSKSANTFGSRVRTISAPLYFSVCWRRKHASDSSAWKAPLWVPIFILRGSRDCTSTSMIRVLGEPNQSDHEEANTTPERFSFFQSQLTKCLASINTFPFTNVAWLIHHPPVYTCQQAEKYVPKPSEEEMKRETGLESCKVAEMKNLFLRDKKKNFFLVSASVHTQIDLKELGGKVKGKGGLSFAAPEYLESHLNLLPGSVSPFGLLNDTENKVAFFLDSTVTTEYNFVAFHPNACSATIVLHVDDFKIFLEQVTKHDVNLLQW
eukprot:Lithocolla_globosa_v1_NODE_2189_length_2118_cov_96.889481.p1 type:complete len:264 gc:universal NODE_2189_length_2118_cov_96.889481:1230-2021(+)